MPYEHNNEYSNVSAFNNQEVDGQHNELLKRELQVHIAKQFNRHSKTITENSQRHIDELVQSESSAINTRLNQEICNFLDRFEVEVKHRLEA